MSLDLALTALAGADDTDNPGDVIGYVLERAEAEARMLAGCFDQKLPATEWLLAIGHIERLQALRAFVTEHLCVRYQNDTDDMGAAAARDDGAERAEGSAES